MSKNNNLVQYFLLLKLLLILASQPGLAAPTLQSAGEKYNSGDYKGALKEFRMLSAAEPDTGKLQFNQSGALMSGHLDRAIELANRSSR